MIISLIAAMAQNRVIGRQHAIPWMIPSDLKLFRDMTLGHTVLFGRVTYESIGRPLQGRRTIVLTGQRHYQAHGASVVHSLEEAFALAKGEEELFIGGGGIVFSETIHLADRIYLSIIQKDFEGDTLFPEIPPGFREKSREEIVDVIPYAFVRYEREDGSVIRPVRGSGAPSGGSRRFL